MATRTERLALEVVSEVSDATQGLDLIGDSASNAVREVSRLDDVLEATGGGVDKLAGAADGLDGAMGAATGAMGALGSGLELAGFEGAAENLQKAALATDFLSGVGQAAALAVQAQGAATKALTVAQRVLNAVMRANPLGLLLVAGLAVAALFVLLYNRSETFRGIVQDAGRVAKAAFVAVADAIGTVITWARDRVGPAFAVVKKMVELYTLPARTAIGLVVDVIRDVVQFAGDIPAKFGALKDKAAEIAAPLLAPFTAVKEALSWIADKLDNLKPPAWLSKLPGMGGDSFTPDARGFAAPPAAAPAPAALPSIVIQGALDPYAVAVQIQALLTRYNLAVS